MVSVCLETGITHFKSDIGYICALGIQASHQTCIHVFVLFQITLEPYPLKLPLNIFQQAF